MLLHVELGFLTLNKLITKYSTVMKKEEKDFLKKVEKLVYEQMKDKHVNCDTVCESLGITNQNLRRKLLAITGQTGGKYLLTIRMKYAQELLAKGKYSIGQVALKCGYDDANNFSRTFKREVGQKPTEFAAIHKEA
jgi:AraC-like DNA-binding protein